MSSHYAVPRGKHVVVLNVWIKSRIHFVNMVTKVANSGFSTMKLIFYSMGCEATQRGRSQNSKSKIKKFTVCKYTQGQKY